MVEDERPLASGTIDGLFEFGTKSVRCLFIGQMDFVPSNDEEEVPESISADGHICG